MVKHFFQKYWATLVALLLGMGFLNGILAIKHSSPVLSFAVQLLVLYLIWAGRGALAPVVFSITILMWLQTLFTPIPDEMLSSPLHLTPAQFWSISLGVCWLVAIVLSVKLAAFSSHLQASGYHKTAILLLLLPLPIVSVSLGHFIQIGISRI